MKAVDEVSMEDITSTAQKLLSTPLTMASYGDGNFWLMRYSVHVSYIHFGD